MNKSSKAVLACLITPLGFGSQLLLANFIDDATAGGKLRTVYYDIEKGDRVYPDTGIKKKSTYVGAWTGSVMLDAKSGYYGDIIGVDASLYGVTKLDMNERNRDSKQLLNADNEGFSKLGQAYIKIKFGDDNLNANFNAGRQMIYNALISSSGSRSVPSTWQGYNLNSHFYGVHLGLVYVDQISLRDQAGFHRLENFDGKRIDYAAGGQIDTSLKNLNLLYRNGYSKDFLQAHNIKIGYNFDLQEGNTLTIDTRYYIAKKEGDLWTGYANWDASPAPGQPYKSMDAAFDDKAENYSLNAKLTLNQWTLVASVSHTKAESQGNLGSYYYDFGKNTHGICDIQTSAFGEDFMYDGETAWKTGGLYDFSSRGAKGLSVGYFFHYGTGMKARNGKTVSENEHDLLLSYLFPQKPLEGLSLKLIAGFYNNDKALRNTISYGKRIDLRAWLDYKFVLF